MVRRRNGFSLIEVVAAFLLLEVGLLAVLGLGALAARESARAARVQRAAILLEVVADSLLREGSAGTGERPMGSHLVRWRAGSGGTALEVVPLSADGRGGVILAVELPGLW